MRGAASFGRGGLCQKRVITRMGQKGYLYPGPVRAILRNPASPLAQLRHFETLIEPLSPNTKSKFAMIGDRQTKDITPPGRLLGENIVTIRLHSLSDAVDAKEVEADRTADSPPQFVADTLAQAKAILLHKKTWGSIRCASRPAYFQLQGRNGPIATQLLSRVERQRGSAHRTGAHRARMQDARKQLLDDWPDMCRNSGGAFGAVRRGRPRNCAGDVSG